MRWAYRPKVLHGRESEQARLAAVLETAAAGRSASLVIGGEPGAGKTALIEDLREQASGWVVLRAQGLESENPLAFAGLRQLLGPVLSLLDRLPGPQARALRVAFGMEDGDRVEPFLVGVATLTILTEAGDTQPVLCLIDDAHWLDTASIDALLFAVRRLEADPIAIVFAAREGHTRTFTPSGIPVLRLKGLGREAARSLLSERSGILLPDQVVEALLEQTSGNPLALVELPATLTRDQLGGITSLPAKVRLSETVQRAFLDRCRRLPEQVQTLLLVAAADDTGILGIVRQAAALLGAEPEAIDVAERAGLLVTENDRLRVSHPLVRSAVYQAATGHERRAAHRALAEALGGSGDPDRRAWHWAASVDGPDPEVVSALVMAAARAERRGGYAAARAAFERAAELTTDEQPRAERNYAAARNAWAAGEASNATALLARAREGTDDRLLRADIDRLRGRIEVNLGTATDAHRIFVDAARSVAADDPSRALEMGAAASVLRAYGADSGATFDPTDITARLASAGSPRIRALTQLLRSMTLAADGQWSLAITALAEGRDVELSDLDSDVLGNLGNAALHLGDDQAHEQYFTAMLSQARQTGSGFLIMYGLHRLAFSQLVSGQWQAVRACAEEALSLSHSVGEPGLAAAPLGWLTLLAALQGRDDYEQRLADLDEVTSTHRIGVLTIPVRDLSHWAQATRAVTESDHVGALDHLQRIRTPAITRMVSVERITAAIRSGERQLAATWVADVDKFAQATGWSWATAAANHCRALLADGDEAVEWFSAALAIAGPGLRPYDRARAQLAYGEHLRRSQHRTEARAHLKSAMAEFEQLGAEPFIARAANELRASGETARKRDPSTALTLTPMELQTAQLAAQIMSNKDIAAQLWISPRTVAFHLRNVFTKTGISSRGELGRLRLE
jgi:DNA-binding CsgD family transcriptional regulator/tetratricopeptide (TPR) repeat protein